MTARANTVIDTDILHQAGLEFDVDSKNQIKNGSSHLRNYNFGLLVKFQKSKLCTNKPNNSFNFK